LIKAIEIISTQGYVTDYLDEANTVYDTKRRDKAIVFFKKFVEVSSKDDPRVQELLKALTDGGYTEWVDELRKVQVSKNK
jgi:hypothetical protein